jgi:hypothetical protein
LIGNCVEQQYQSSQHQTYGGDNGKPLPDHQKDLSPRVERVKGMKALIHKSLDRCGWRA